MIRAVLRAVTLLSLFLGLSLVARANTIRVPEDQPTLNAALGAAAEGDAIVLADGVYSEGSLELDNRGVTIQSKSGDPTACILDATPLFFFQHEDNQFHTLMLQGLTLRNAAPYPISMENDNPLDGFSGGASITVSDCIVSNNFGGLTLGDPFGTVTVAHCTFNNPYGYTDLNAGGPSIDISDCRFTNSGASVGGSPVSIVRCTFAYSTLDLFSNSNAPFTVTDSTFDHSSSGTALMFNGFAPHASCLIKNCAFTNNSGAGAVLSWSDQSANLTVANCTFANNSTDNNYGGAIFNLSGNLTVFNSTFVHNTANVQGGAIAVLGGATTLLDCTFADNQANGGGAVSRFDFGNGNGDFHIANCIFWGNTAPSGPQIQNLVDAPPAQIANSLIQNYPGLTATPDQNGNFTADPRFVRTPSPGPDGQWGTADDDFGDLHLLFGSPAIDSGNTALLPPDTADLNNNGNTTEPLPVDLDGAPRISRAQVDLGAYEYQNQAPTANPQSLSLNQNTSLPLTLTGSDPENDALTYAVITGPAHGALSGTAPNLTYTPNPGFVGSDSFTFQVQDLFGALSNVAAVNLTIKDTTPPVITLNGSNPMTVNQGGMFTDPGATAVDNVDGPVPVSVSGSVNTALPGTYTLTYSASDKAGNKASKTRTVNVVAAPILQVKLTSLGEFAQFVGVIVTIQNSGAAPATDVRITSASLIGVNASLIAPNTWFNLAAGKSAQVGLLFYPLQKGRTGTLSISGSYSGGTFSLNQAVVIP